MVGMQFTLLSRSCLAGDLYFHSAEHRSNGASASIDHSIHSVMNCFPCRVSNIHLITNLCMIIQYHIAIDILYLIDQGQIIAGTTVGNRLACPIAERTASVLEKFGSLSGSSTPDLSVNPNISAYFFSRDKPRALFTCPCVRPLSLYPTV